MITCDDDNAVSFDEASTQSMSVNPAGKKKFDILVLKGWAKAQAVSKTS